jgi:MSHA pilin protein MshC
MMGPAWFAGPIGVLEDGTTMAKRTETRMALAAQRGFTLVELIVVIVIVGIMSAVAASRFFERNSYDVAGYAEQVRATLRYGQKLAVAQNRAVYARLNGSSVGLCFAPACAVADQVPRSGAAGSTAGAAYCGAAPWACVDNPAGVSYTSGAASFYFDALGKPYAAADPVGAVTSTFAPLTLSISGTGGARVVTVEAETGYVH